MPSGGVAGRSFGVLACYCCRKLCAHIVLVLREIEMLCPAGLPFRTPNRVGPCLQLLILLVSDANPAIQRILTPFQIVSHFSISRFIIFIVYLDKLYI